MHFETKIINGKPSIFFTEGKYPVIKKTETRNKTRKDLNLIKSISGEVDVVAPTPTSRQQQQHLASNGLLNKPSSKSNNLRLNLNSNEENRESSTKESVNRIQKGTLQNNLNINNTNLNNFIEENPIIEKFKENIEVRDSKPAAYFNQGSNFNENIYIDTQLNSNNSNYNKESYSENLNPPQQPVQQLPVFKSTMTLAEKKRLQWQQERENLEMIAKHSNSINNLTKLPNSNKNDTDFNYDQASVLRQANSLDNLNLAKDTSELKNTPYNNPNRFTLMQKKKQQWDQDLKEAADSWTPYGRNDPVATATAILNDPQIAQALTQHQQQPPAYEVQNPKTRKYKDSLEEFQSISKTLEAITAVENKLKHQDQLNAINELNKQKELESKKKFQQYDQSKVPAAMRTSLMFGDVLFDDEIKKTKELERKKWLEDLEFQKRDKLLQSQKNLFTESNTTHVPNTNLAQINDRDFMNSDKKSVISTTRSNNSEERSYARTRNLLDPAQIEEMERQKLKSLQHVKEIEAQILEKKRLQNMENDMQSLKSLGMDNNNSNQLLMTDRGTHRKPILPTETNIIESQKSDRDSNDSRIKEAFRTTKLAELAAAEEKHVRLVKRLKQGGHDFRNLEKKFAEYKAKILAEINEEPAPQQHQKTTASDKESYRMIDNIFGSRPDYNAAQNNNAAHGREQDTERGDMTSNKNDLINKINKNHAQLNSINDDNVISEKKINQIFNILREDTQALPAEVTEEQLKALIKNVMLSESKQSKSMTKGTQSTKTNNPKEKKIKSAEKPKVAKPNTKDMKPPIWNYKNLNGQKPVKNSEKDPFYKERQLKKVEQKQILVEKNTQKFNDYVASKRVPPAPSSLQDDSERDRNFSDDASTYHYNDASSRNSPMSNAPSFQNNRKSSVNSYVPDTNNNINKTRSQNQENVMALLNKNLGKSIIYEEDEDRGSINQEFFNTNNNNNKNIGLKPAKLNDSRELENGFVPFMRTNEFLDPAHATSPIPPSRETSAIKRDREKARQAYFQNMKPADHGKILNNNSQMSYRNKDPLLNNGLVKDNPTPRQAEILAQLAVLKKSLIKKQKEVASSIAIDDNMSNGYDLDDQNY